MFAAKTAKEEDAKADPQSEIRMSGKKRLKSSNWDSQQQAENPTYKWNGFDAIQRRFGRNGALAGPPQSKAYQRRARRRDNSALGPRDMDMFKPKSHLRPEKPCSSL